MNKKRFIFGILTIMFAVVCGSLLGSIPSVFATQNTGIQTQASAQNEAGTFEGEGSYSAGDSISLKATMNLGYDFLYWEAFDTEGNKVQLESSGDNKPTNLEYTFVTDKDITVGAKYRRAGTFEGEGFYIVGDEAELQASMEEGYKFDAWIMIEEDGQGNEIKTQLSTQQTFKFKVEKSVTIKPTWSRIEYAVNIDESLTDFSKSVVNNSQQTGINYYGDEIIITLALNPEIDDLYIYDIVSNNVLINNTPVSTIIANEEENTMSLQCEINNGRVDANGKNLGFNSLTIRLNINQDVDINVVDYVHMHKLTISSGNEIDIDNVLDFIVITDDENTSSYYQKLDQYTYLLREDKNLTINISEGDSVYKLNKVEISDPNSFTQKLHAYYMELKQDTEFKVYYSRINYTINFEHYLKNLNEEYNIKEEPIYNIASVLRPAGDEFTIKYDSATKIITIEYVTHTYSWDATSGQYVISNTETFEEQYTYPDNLYGYRFVGFAINQELLTDSNNTDDIFSHTYKTSPTAPSDVEIQLLFEYIEYEFNIVLVDSFFEEGIEYSYAYSNGTSKLVKDTTITVRANTSQYSIKGWSLNQYPDEDDYILMEGDNFNDGSASVYTFAFAPQTDDNTEKYNIYLDVEYKYSSVDYVLKSTNIEQNIEYDKVDVDIDAKTITFSDTTAKLQPKAYSFVIKEESINNIGSATTYALNLYSEFKDGVYNNKFGKTSIETDPETNEEIEVFTEEFADVVIYGIPVNLVEITVVDGVETGRTATTSDSHPVLQYKRENIEYASVLSVNNITITKTVTQVYNKKYVKCDSATEGAKLVVANVDPESLEPVEPLGENEIYLSDVGIDGIVVGDYVVLTDVPAGGPEIKYSIGGAAEYTFDKYVYYGLLQAGVVEYLTLTEIVGVTDTIEITLNGTIFDNTNTKGLTDQAIHSTEVVKEYDANIGAYKLSYIYDMNLYMTNGQSGDYDYIELRNIKYYYNATTNRFELKRAEYNKAKAVEGEMTRYADYRITINNLLDDSLVMYFTKSTNTELYKIASIKSSTGSAISRAVVGEYNVCILNALTTPIIQVEYRKLEKEVSLVINKEGAYSYDNISFVITKPDGSYSVGSGDTITAAYGSVIVVSIVTDYINPGYMFKEYVFEEQEPVTELTYIFEMSAEYENAIININFDVIQYTLNINYFDKNIEIIDKDIVNADNAHGKLVRGENAEMLTEIIVDIESEYLFNAIANEGYYTSFAYIDNDECPTTLTVTNNSTILKTSWTLDVNNFKQYIIDNADQKNNVDMYIYFKIHTYSVKVYFEIEGNEGLITYPNLYINNKETPEELLSKNETIDGVEKTRYYISTNGFEYGSNVVFTLAEFMPGIKLNSWNDANGKLSGANVYTVYDINSNKVLTVKLEYITYTLKFKPVDTEDNACTYGVGEIVGVNGYKLNEVVYYNIYANTGYISQGKYYINTAGSKQTEGIDSGFTFDPANFQTENNTFTIYLVFDLKSVNILLSNNQSSKLAELEDWASYTVSRIQNGKTEILDLTSGYSFRTGDTLIMELSTAKMGIELSKITFAGIDITTTDTVKTNYKLVNVTSTQDVCRKYIFTLTFEADFIESLESETEMVNHLTLKTYNIKYSYNLIDYDFSLKLYIKSSGSFSTGGIDEPMMKTIRYGSSHTFTCDESTIQKISNNFDVKCFTVAGQEYVTEGAALEFKGLEMWEQLALKNLKDVDIVLVLIPQIKLEGYDEKLSTSDRYVYLHTYNSERQGINSENIIVGGESKFETVVEYWDGTSYTSLAPKNVGEYQVYVYAKLSETVKIRYEKNVEIYIQPKTLSVAWREYNGSKYLSKRYDGQNGANVDDLFNYVQLEGVCGTDNIIINKNALSVTYSGVDANANIKGELYRRNGEYNVYINNITLTSDLAVTVNNYVISAANIIFEDVGVITAKPLIIKGFKPKDKVFDDSEAVEVETSGIIYEGMIKNDSAYILTANLQFYLKDTSVGVGREVGVIADNAITGIHSTNYSVTFEKKYIDIYPYEISYTVSGRGTFKIVDAERKCLIPIGAQMFTNVYEKGANEYNALYSFIESDVAKGQKLKACYEIGFRCNGVQQAIPEGLYIYIPKINKVISAHQMITDEEVIKLAHRDTDKYTILKAEGGEGLFGVVVKTTYIPLWLIILIVCIVAVVILVLVVVFIIIRRKTKQKYNKYDRI